MTDRICSAEGCDARFYAKGWCRKHWERMRRTGRLTIRTIEERLWEKVDKTATCWLFQGATLNGYGWLSVGGNQSRTTHRLAYESLVGPIPDGLQLDHLCRVRNCVNPDHLEPVTQAVNKARGQRAMQTHCIHGHVYDEANTYRQKNGTRSCRACHREQERRRQRRLRAS